LQFGVILITSDYSGSIRYHCEARDIKAW